MRNMKDSGVEWIGEIPEGWCVGQIKRFFDIQLGKMVQPTQIGKFDSFEFYLCAANLGNNVLKTDNLKQMWISPNEKNIYSLSKGDLLVVEGGDVASCDIVPFEIPNVFFQNSLHRVRSINGHSVSFLRYQIMNAKNTGTINLICNKATIAHFTKEKFGKLPHMIPPLPEQEAIAEYLDKVCGEIDGLVKDITDQIAILKDYKKSVISEAVTKGLNPNAKMKDSGVEWIGEIPKGWMVRRLKYSLLTVVGSNNDGFKVGLENIESCTGRFIETEAEFDGAGISFKKGDILFGKLRPYLMKTWVAEREGIAVGDFFVYRATSEMNNRFAKYILLSPSFISVVNASTYGAKMPRVSSIFMDDMYIPLPPLPEQQAIADYLDEKCKHIDEAIELKQQQLEKLAAYKASVIYEYVTGKKEVPHE